MLLGLQLMNNGPNFPVLAANYEWADADDQRAPSSAALSSRCRSTTSRESASA